MYANQASLLFQNGGVLEYDGSIMDKFGLVWIRVHCRIRYPFSSPRNMLDVVVPLLDNRNHLCVMLLTISLYLVSSKRSKKPSESRSGTQGTKKKNTQQLCRLELVYKYNL